MTNTVQVDKIMSEVNALGNSEKAALFHRIEEQIKRTNSADENVTIESVFGLWKDRDITLSKIRQKAWQPK